MKFFIVASNGSEKVKVYAKECFYITSDLSKAVAKFNKINNERRFKHTYLIVDFEQHTRLDAKKALKYDENAEILPYLVLGEYHHNYVDPDYAIRGDKLIVCMKGARFEFNDNLRALRMYLSMLKHDPKAKLEIEYIVERFGKPGIKNQTICSFNDMKGRFAEELYPIQRFEIESITWEPAPMTPRKLYLVDLKHERIYDRTFSLDEEEEKKEIQLFP